MNKEEFKNYVNEIAKNELRNSFDNNLMETLNSAFIFKYVETLEKENKELKEQVDYLRRSIERKEEIISDAQNEIIPYTHEYVTKLINRQNNFIEWLTNEININPYDISDYTYEDIINTILSKYYEIIEK